MEYFRQRFVEELNDEGLVNVRTFEGPPADVLQTMAPHDYEAHFLDWVASQKQNAKAPEREAYADVVLVKRLTVAIEKLNPTIPAEARGDALRKVLATEKPSLVEENRRLHKLTGFDAPSMHTMYIDKPMKGHGLMQAIARVNRVFRDKPAGLVVDYIGIAQNLKNALGQYSGSDQRQAGIDEAEAVAVLLEKYEVVKPKRSQRTGLSETRRPVCVSDWP